MSGDAPCIRRPDAIVIYDFTIYDLRFWTAMESPDKRLSILLPTQENAPHGDYSRWRNQRAHYVFD